MTFLDFLVDSVNFPVTEGAVKGILSVRGVAEDALFDGVSERVRRLCSADLLVWICRSPHRMGAVTDRDNGWEHSDGGFTLTDDERRFLLGQANAIYEEYGEPKVGAARVRVTNYGIKVANKGCNPGYAVTFTNV